MVSIIVNNSNIFKGHTSLSQNPVVYVPNNLSVTHILQIYLYTNTNLSFFEGRRNCYK